MRYSIENRSSARRQHSFVEGAISELMSRGCLREASEYHQFCNPLHIAVQSSGKLRLILDLSHLNKFVVKKSAKYEDLSGSPAKSGPLDFGTKNSFPSFFVSGKGLRATCCTGHLYLCRIEKNRFSENLSGRRFLLTCFKIVTLRLFGFLFSSPDGILYFAPKRAKLGPEITLFAKASKPKYCA